MDADVATIVFVIMLLAMLLLLLLAISLKCSARIRECCEVNKRQKLRKQSHLGELQDSSSNEHFYETEDVTKLEDETFIRVLPYKPQLPPMEGQYLTHVYPDEAASGSEKAVKPRKKNVVSRLSSSLKDKRESFADSDDTSYEDTDQLPLCKRHEDSGSVEYRTIFESSQQNFTVDIVQITNLDPSALILKMTYYRPDSVLFYDRQTCVLCRGIEMLTCKEKLGWSIQVELYPSREVLGRTRMLYGEENLTFNESFRCFLSLHDYLYSTLRLLVMAQSDESSAPRIMGHLDQLLWQQQTDIGYIKQSLICLGRGSAKYESYFRIGEMKLSFLYERHSGILYVHLISICLERTEDNKEYSVTIQVFNEGLLRQKLNSVRRKPMLGSHEVNFNMYIPCRLQRSEVDETDLVLITRCHRVLGNPVDIGSVHVGAGAKGKCHTSMIFGQSCKPLKEELFVIQREVPFIWRGSVGDTTTAGMTN